ncbi:hypothetical protein HanXRQr2_Chr13g0579841 [Helianthus annuus]|uniref:Uncharacterized protein n=1 Tax=Helianthus annuus TaxID=4232 RepID=A0A251SQS1_HELAN|nr:hypothetical protein HanXRQr2_Chr13g0579841 [Helianthus annuus]KAJ0848483.1 hypothetical protein HanPSC8_Chr13g0557991 [Helianthus annuus]
MQAWVDSISSFNTPSLAQEFHRLRSSLNKLKESKIRLEGSGSHQQPLLKERTNLMRNTGQFLGELETLG